MKIRVAHLGSSVDRRGHVFGHVLARRALQLIRSIVMRSSLAQRDRRHSRESAARNAGTRYQSRFLACYAVAARASASLDPSGETLPEDRNAVPGGMCLLQQLERLEDHRKTEQEEQCRCRAAYPDD